MVAGERLTLTCTVSRGDEPLSLSWLWDGAPLPPGPSRAGALKVLILNAFNSVLTVEQVEQRHAGVYTCVAANAAAEARLSFSLTVHGTVPSCPWLDLLPQPFICVMTEFLTFVFYLPPLQFPLVFNLLSFKRVCRKACERVWFVA